MCVCYFTFFAAFRSSYTPYDYTYYDIAAMLLRFSCKDWQRTALALVSLHHLAFSGSAWSAFQRTPPSAPAQLISQLCCALLRACSYADVLAWLPKDWLARKC